MPDTAPAGPPVRAAAPGPDDAAAPTAAPGEIVDERRITDLETLRMLADPLRLAVLGAMPHHPSMQPVTVKEVAEKLDEGQTKLYRHVKQLEEAGLIVVAETRVVSGIIEKRYRSAQRRLTIDGDLLRTAENAGELSNAMVAVLDATRTMLSADLRAGRVVLERPEQGPDLSIQSASVRTWMQPEKFAALRAEISRLVDELGPRDESPGAIPVVIQTLMYASPEPELPSVEQGRTRD